MSKKAQKPAMRELTPKQPEQFDRSAQFVRESINEEARTVEVAFSSEEPVERYWGDEILSHDAEAVDLSRLNNGAAVLVDHTTRQHVGVVVAGSARIDSDRKGRAVLRFGRGALASEIFEDIVDGIRQLTSVGYSVMRWLVDEKAASRTAVKWQPFEISIVSVPADATVGVNRELTRGEPEMADETITGEGQQPEGPATGNRAQPTPTPAPAPTPVDPNQVRREERERIRAIEKLAEENDLAELGKRAIDEGKTADEFKLMAFSEIGKRNNEQRVKLNERQKASHWGDLDGSGEPIELQQHEQRQYSLMNVLYALANPNDKRAQEAIGFEREISDHAAQKLNINVRGIYVPTSIAMGAEQSELVRGMRTANQSVEQRALDAMVRTLTAGTATDGAELVGTSLLASSFIDVLRNAMAVRAAGARMMTGLVGNVDIPRKTSGAAATWISTEGGDAAEGEAQFDQVTLTPNDLAAYTDISRRLSLQSTPAIEGLVRDDLAQALAIGLDAAALYGSGSSGQPRGVANQTGINTFDLAAADPTYAETVRMVKEVMADNALMGSLRYIIDPAGWEAAMTTEKATNTARFIMENGMINGYPVTTTNQVTAEEWFFGNWSDLMIGMWGGVDIAVDSSTLSRSGGTRFVAFLTADVAVRHPVSFCYAHDGVA